MNLALRVDFSRPELCAQTRPLTCAIKGQSIVLYKKNWSQLLVSITEWFLAERNLNIDLLDHKPLYGNKTFFLPTRSDVGTCSLLSNGKWIYTNHNPQGIVTVIRNLCQHCGIDLNDVVITYEREKCASVSTVCTYSCSNYTTTDVPSLLEFDTALIKQLTDVLLSHFTNGYRLNSPIEMVRFRSFATKDLGEELSLDNEKLKYYIMACGVIFNGKVYAVSTQAKKRIKVLAENYFAEGAQAIFFSEFYAKNKSWLSEASVISEDMLINIFHELFANLYFTRTYFGCTNVPVFEVLRSEILRVWGDDVLNTYTQLAERLRYIPIERIKSHLGQNGDFIWNNVETFSHISRIDITDEEREVIREAAAWKCNDRGYVSIPDLPFCKIEERNYKLSITAVHNAIYHTCLSEKFDKKDKIIMRKGEVIDALTIMKEYCRTIDKCSLDDLLTYEKELTGKVYPLIPMEAGNSVLVRIDKNSYVADKYVYFDVEVIDEAIGRLVKEDYLALKSFTTFGTFPDCGQTWNLFLLESYCRRFSQKFRFDTIFVNSRNVGAVIRKSCYMDYMEIMADAVANSGVSLQDAAVGMFLYKSGYTGRRITAKVNEIINKAKNIREKKD